MNNYLYDWYREDQMNNKTKLYNPTEGFLKGNLFQNLYEEYKNYKPQNLKTSNEQESKLYEIMSLCFAAHELNLYLDLHPEDQSMYMLFKDYNEKINVLTKDYEQKYGPICVKNSETNEFLWSKKDFPWENRRGY